MASVFASGNVSLPTGKTTIPQRSVGAPVSKAELTIARCTSSTPTVWANSATTVVVALEVSYDGGITWFGGGGFSAKGGIELDSQSNEVPALKVGFGYSSNVTDVRGEVNVANGPLTTSVSIDRS